MNVTRVHIQPKSNTAQQRNEHKTSASLRGESLTFSARRIKAATLSLGDMIDVHNVAAHREKLESSPLVRNPHIPLTVLKGNSKKVLVRSVLFDSTPGFEQVQKELRKGYQQGVSKVILEDKGKDVSHVFSMFELHKGQPKSAEEMKFFDQALKEVEDFVPFGAEKGSVKLSDEKKIDVLCREMCIKHKKV